MASPLTYVRASGFATCAGLEFEMCSCALVFLQGWNSGLIFQIGCNVQGAGLWNDLLVRCKPRGAPSHWRTVYIQHKHRDRASVYLNMLTNHKGDFSLPCYFKSYLDIKKKKFETSETLLDGSFEDSQFVIFTNANGEEDLGEMCENYSLVEGLVRSGSGKVISFEKDQNILTCLKKIGEDEGAFLRQFRLYCCQPNANELKEAVKEELFKLDAEIIRGLSIDRLCECFLANVKVWYERRTGKADILHNEHNILLKSVEKVRLESCSEQTLKDYILDLEFEQASLPLLGASPPLPGASPPLPGASPPLPGAGVSVVQCSAGSCRLSLTKLVQASQGRCLVLTCKQLLENQRALLAEWRKEHVKRLIVCTQDWSLELASACFQVIQQMVNSRRTFSVLDIVFLLDGNSRVGIEQTEFQGKCHILSDEFEILQLTDESRNKLFYKVVHLQGYNTTLLKLLANDCASASQVLDASSVVAIMKSADPLTVGSALPEGIGYFVERTLEWTCVKASVFGDLQGTVTIRVTQRAASARALLERAMDFVCSLNDHPSFKQEVKEDVVNKLDKSQLVADDDDGAVYVGPKFPLGFYECSCVGLRFGQDNAATALRVCPSDDVSEKVSFLFVSNETNKDDAGKFSEYHKSKHLFSLKDGQLRWIWSQGDYEFVRQHFDEDQVQELKPETATDVEDRLVLLCSKPGRGKSTLVTRLAKDTKAAQPHFFVVFLALKDHTESFARGEHEDVLGFLSSATKMDSPWKRSLLKHALEVSGNVVVIADGFDEIAPKYVEECCQLLSSLLGETKVSKIWITSRNSIKQTLEARFSKFSARLRKFNKEAQREFLKKFWTGISSLSERELYKFIDQLLLKTSQAVRDKAKNFMGSPLFMQMLAEVYEDHVTGSAENAEIPVIPDLLQLLEMFFEKKFRVYLEVKHPMVNHLATYDTSYEMFKNTFMASHSKAALSLIIGDDDLKTLGMEGVIRESSEFCKTISCGEERAGFVVDIENGKPRFLHRIVAEYFVAKWISKSLAENAKLIKSKLFTADLGVVRNLVDRILSKDSPLHTAVLGADPEQVRTLLESQVEFIKNKDGGGRTALHLAAGLGTSEDREENVRHGKILDLLIDKTSDFRLADDVLGGSPLRYADITQTWVAIDKLLSKLDNNDELVLTLVNVTQEGMLGTIFDLDLDILLGFCLDNGLAVEHCSEGKGRLLFRACEKGSLKVASKLIERNANIDHVIDSEKDRSPLRIASALGHLAIVKLLCEKLAKSPHLDAFKHLHMKDKNGNTAVYLASANNHIDVTSLLLSSHFDFLSHDFADSSTLLFAAFHNNLDALRTLLDNVQDEAARTSVVNTCDDNGRSVLHYAALGGSLACVKLLVQAGAKLTQVGGDGVTTLMAAARLGKHEVICWLMCNFNAGSEDTSLAEFINTEDKDGKTAVHHAAWGGHSTVIKSLIDEGGDAKSRDLGNRTPLHLAAEWNHPLALTVLLEALKEEDRIALLNSCGDDGDGVLMRAALGGCLGCVELLVQAGGKLSQVNRNGETPLMAAARKGKQEVVKWMLCNFNSESEGMSMLDFIKMEDKDGKTAYGTAGEECRFLMDEMLDSSSAVQ